MAARKSTNAKKIGAENEIAKKGQHASEILENEKKEEGLQAPEGVRNKALEFSVGQLSGTGNKKPEGQPEDPAPDVMSGIEDTPEFKAALEKRLAAMQKANPEKTPKEKREKDTQHGITRPGENTLCGKIWAAADAITAKFNQPAPVDLVRAANPTVNLHTVKTQYARWRAYNGIQGRVEFKAPVETKAPEGESTDTDKTDGDSTDDKAE